MGMKRFFAVITVLLIFIAAVFAFLAADKNAKDVADFLESNTVFSVDGGTVTILNEKIVLR